MDIPESLAFEIIGRKEILIEIQRQQIAQLQDRVRALLDAVEAAQPTPEPES